MIVEAILSVVFGVVNIILAPVSVLSWGFDVISYLSPLGDILAIVYYVLPIGKLAPIISFIVAMFIFRAVIALIKTIWAVLPFV